MIIKGRAIEAADRADALLELAEEHLGELEPYGINRDRLNQFDDLDGEFSRGIGRPRALIIARKEARQSLPELFALADTHLARMDRLSGHRGRGSQRLRPAGFARAARSCMSPRPVRFPKWRSQRRRGGDAREELAQAQRALSIATKLAERDTHAGRAQFPPLPGPRLSGLRRVLRRNPKIQRKHEDPAPGLSS